MFESESNQLSRKPSKKWNQITPVKEAVFDYGEIKNQKIWPFNVDEVQKLCQNLYRVDNYW